MHYWILLCACVGATMLRDVSHSYIKVSTNRKPHCIKETVSIIDSKLLAIPSKTHLPYLSFKRFCSLINNRGMNEQGDKSDTLLSWGLGAELRVCISILSLPSFSASLI